jgi:hypothetical protein
MDMSIPEILTSYFLPIFRASGTTLPEHEGTGLLVSTPSAKWLVTAAHVMATHAGSEFFLPGYPSLFPIFGQVYSTSELTLTDTQNDRLDLAFVKLTAVDSESLVRAGMAFYSAERDTILAEPKDFTDNWCYIGGYPNMAVDVSTESLTSHGHPFIFRGALSPNSKMKLCRYDPQRQIGIRYGQMFGPDGAPIKRPDPTGMSGGPIWVSDAGRLRLAGIMIEFDKARSTIIGVRTLDLFQTMEMHSAKLLDADHPGVPIASDSLGYSE